MRLTWLPAVLRKAGLHVVELDGWEGRGVALSRVDACVWHHTATRSSSRDEAVAGILRDGRSDLPGPLSQLGLDRTGRWWVIASGRCNHNGRGTYGNHSVGIEAFNDGTEPWPQKQLDSWWIGTAAIVARLQLPTDRVVAHRETDPTRKRDPHSLDMNEMRRRVQTLRTVVPASPQEDQDEMRYPPAGYFPLRINLDGKGSEAIPVPFRDVTAVTVVANENGSLPDARVLPGAAFDGNQTVLYAEGSPGSVGVIVGYRKA